MFGNKVSVSQETKDACKLKYGERTSLTIKKLKEIFGETSFTTIEAINAIGYSTKKEISRFRSWCYRAEKLGILKRIPSKETSSKGVPIAEYILVGETKARKLVKKAEHQEETLETVVQDNYVALVQISKNDKETVQITLSCESKEELVDKFNALAGII